VAIHRDKCNVHLTY